MRFRIKFGMLREAKSRKAGTSRSSRLEARSKKVMEEVVSS